MGVFVRMRRLRGEGGVMAVVVTICVVVVIALFLIGWPMYNVWRREMLGRSELAQAEWNKQILIREADARLEAAKLDAEAEAIRAAGMARAMEIESGRLTETYIKYLWVRMMVDNPNVIKVYIPTEAGLPILEVRP